MSVEAKLRSMTDEERILARELLARAGPRLVREIATTIIFVAFGAVLGALVGAIVVAIALPYGPWTYRGQITFAVLGVVIELYWAWMAHERESERRRPLEEDAWGGVVEELDVEAFIAWLEIDSVPAFTLDVATEQPLHVKGEALAPAVAEGTFPCRRFRLVRLPTSRHALSVEPLGEALAVRA